MFKNKEAGALSMVEMNRRSNQCLYWLIFAFLSMVVVVCLLPPIWIFISSFKSLNELLQVPPTLLPKKWDIRKLWEVWNKLNFGRYYLNTLILAMGSVVFSITFNGMAGYVLSCLKPKGSGLILSAILWTMLLPNTLSLVPLYKNMIDFPIFGWNLTDTYWPMWLCSGAGAFTILLFKSFFDGISKSLVEAAKLDGCGNIRLFTSIILPLSKPVIAVNAISTLNGVWGDFLLPYLIIQDPDKRTVMGRIYALSKDINFTQDEHLMSLVFAIIPPIIMFCFFQKQIMYGVNLGGVKE